MKCMYRYFVFSSLALAGITGWFLGVAGYAEDEPMKREVSFMFNPIGTFHSPLTPETGAPRQGRFADPPIKGSIEIHEAYEACLDGVEDFTHLYVLFAFDRSEGWHAKVTPPHAEKARGLFATRSPNRPNPIGLTVVRLQKREGRILHVDGVDAFDGTPVLDIKPYIGSLDAYPEASRGVEDDLGIDHE
jgi:tRNA-Thr(GGU) m(6)t(6)A37 methyltransferase TsaA